MKNEEVPTPKSGKLSYFGKKLEENEVQSKEATSKVTVEIPSHPPVNKHIDLSHIEDKSEDNHGTDEEQQKQEEDNKDVENVEDNPSNS